MKRRHHAVAAVVIIVRGFNGRLRPLPMIPEDRNSKGTVVRRLNVVRCLGNFAFAFGFSPIRAGAQALGFPS